MGRLASYTRVALVGTTSVVRQNEGRLWVSDVAARRGPARTDEFEASAAPDPGEPRSFDVSALLDTETGKLLVTFPTKHFRFVGSKLARDDTACLVALKLR